jgi:probable F420-dependent oxidoreductase
MFPQTELAGNLAGVAAVGRATEELGYHSLFMPDHVVGAERSGRDPEMKGPYTEDDPFHDPFVVFGYLAALTSRIQLVTGVLILPQRQTVLAAQQAADVDILSGGRLRLGIGVGWNHVEYDALGQDFRTRGARLDEQLDLMRQLWRDRLVTFDGRFDRIERGCINPRPAREIPIALSGYSEAAYNRAVRSAQGFVFAGAFDASIEAMARLRELLAQAGRADDPFDFDILLSNDDTPEQIAQSAARWRDAGGTQVAVVTVRRGFDTVDAHVDRLGEVSERLGLVDGEATKI